VGREAEDYHEQAVNYERNTKAEEEDDSKFYQNKASCEHNESA
jgi:hypothetical protein